MKHAYRILDPATGLPTETPSYSGVPSAEAISEIAGPVGVVAAVATGSLPVSSAEVGEVVAMLERRAEKLSDPDDTEEDRRYVEALYYCANVLNRHAFYLRRQVEHSTERQPEENTTVSRDAGADGVSKPLNG